MKSDSLVSIKYVFLNLSGFFVDSKSVHVGFSGFLKHVGYLIRFLNLQVLQNVFRGESSMQ